MSTGGGGGGDGQGVQRGRHRASKETRANLCGEKEEVRFKIVQIKHAIISDLLQVYLDHLGAYSTF